MQVQHSIKCRLHAWSAANYITMGIILKFQKLLGFLLKFVIVSSSSMFVIWEHLNIVKYIWKGFANQM